MHFNFNCDNFNTKELFGSSRPIEATVNWAISFRMHSEVFLWKPREQITMHLIGWWIHGANPVMEFQKWVSTVCKPVNHRTVAAGPVRPPSKCHFQSIIIFHGETKRYSLEMLYSTTKWEKIEKKFNVNCPINTLIVYCGWTADAGCVAGTFTSSQSIL